MSESRIRSRRQERVTLANPDVHETDSPAAAPGEAGSGTKEDGYFAYYEICNQILDNDWELVTKFPGYMGPGEVNTVL